MLKDTKKSSIILFYRKEKDDADEDENKNEELTYLKTLAEKKEKDLDDIKKKIAEVEAYNPSELTEQKLKEILKDATETN